MKKTVFIFILVLLAAPAVSAASFGPWQRRVAVGDGIIIRGKHHHHPGNSTRSVYNGFQGGAWMLIRFFQRAISPLDGPNCRFKPVCSAYGREAVEKYGALVGAIMAGERLLRCNPYNRGGYDPVPEPGRKK